MLNLISEQDTFKTQKMPCHTHHISTNLAILMISGGIKDAAQLPRPAGEQFDNIYKVQDEHTLNLVCLHHAQRIPTQAHSKVHVSMLSKAKL